MNSDLYVLRTIERVVIQGPPDKGGQPTLMVGRRETTFSPMSLDSAVALFRTRNIDPDLVVEAKIFTLREIPKSEWGNR